MSIFGMSIAYFKSNDARPYSMRDNADRVSNLTGGRRSKGRSAILIAAILFGSAATPAFALTCSSVTECQEAQVEDLLRSTFTDQNARGGITMYTVTVACTRMLMHGSPEQDPELGKVRFTPTAVQFLANCALTKGLSLKK